MNEKMLKWLGSLVGLMVLVGTIIFAAGKIVQSVDALALDVEAMKQAQTDFASKGWMKSLGEKHDRLERRVDKLETIMEFWKESNL